MSNFSIEPYFDPIKQWRYYIANDVAMRMPYDIDDPLFLQKVSVLQAEQVKQMVAGSYSQTAAFRNETDANFVANRQAVEKGMNMLGSRITQVGGMITHSLENGFAAMNYGFTDLSNKVEIANAYLSDLNKGMALSNRYSQQIVQSIGQLNAGVTQVNQNLVETNNNLIAINRTLSVGFSILSVSISSKLDFIIEELRIPETQRERRYHIQEGMKYLAQATKDNDDLYFEDALDEFQKAINIESKDFFSHYYAGYIYMYSKAHLDIDKAVDHLQRFIHYAKAALDTALAKSLWDDGCYNLSLSYYIQGKLSDAMRTIALEIGNSEKVLLQQAKYLSLGNDVEKQQAMEVVTKILHKNPYAVMLLMQDKDLLMNPYLVGHIERLRIESYSKAKDGFMEIKEVKGSIGIWLMNDEAVFDSFLRQNTYLAAIAAENYYLQEGRMWCALKMIKVEGGSFNMGTVIKEEAFIGTERPVHRVTVSTFSIGQTEVTQSLWEKVMGNNPSSNVGDDLPVDSVNWNDCQEFIRRLNQKTGKKFRLPTEAEWEYAARGGNKSCGYKYSGSNNLDEVGWFENNSLYKTQPVKSKKPNELGVFDMSGNVMEWCQDWFGYYNDDDTQINPTGPSSGTYRMMRGGSISDYAIACQVSSRHNIPPEFRGYMTGFRLCHPL